MPELSRSQVAVYGAVAVALLLIGARAIRAEPAGPPSAVGLAPAREGGSFSVTAGGGEVVVDVAGGVRRPGVYRLPAGSRVTDAIERAGGTARGARVEAVNRAARLADGQQVVIPVGGPAIAGAGVGVSPDGPISLGTATAEQLETIEGIGPVTAGKIVEFRNQRGGLASIEQLGQVSGIGPATMDLLRDRLQP